MDEIEKFRKIFMGL